MITVTTTNARSNLFQIVKKAIKGHVLTKISSKEGSVVLISEDEYESLLETAELLSIDDFKDSIERSDMEIENDELYGMDEVFS